MREVRKGGMEGGREVARVHRMTNEGRKGGGKEGGK